MIERWMPVPGFAAYKISNYGRLKLKPTHDNLSGYFPRGRTRRKPRISKGATINVALRVDGRNVWFRRSQLVLLAFVGPKPDPRSVARHLDDDPTNNHLDNLAWGSFKDNYDDAVRNGSHGGPGAPSRIKQGASLKARLAQCPRKHRADGSWRPTLRDDLRAHWRGDPGHGTVSKVYEVTE